MKEIITNKVFNGHNLAITHLDTGSKDLVIFCHGYRSSNIGPSRVYVDISRRLAQQNISSFRFDQYCSGNSEGNFVDSSFIDWVETTKEICNTFIKDGYRVSLFGQSIGGAVVIAVASMVPEIISAVTWVPDPNTDEFEVPNNGFIEEGGQIVKDTFWKEVHNMNLAQKLSMVKASMYIIQCSDDEHVDEMNRKAIVDNAQPQHTIELLDGYSHSKWNYEQLQQVMQKSIDYIVGKFN